MESNHHLSDLPLSMAPNTNTHTLSQGSIWALFRRDLAGAGTLPREISVIKNEIFFFANFTLNIDKNSNF